MRQFARSRTTAVYALCVAALVMAACVGMSAQSAASSTPGTQTVRVVGGTITLRVARMNGLFTKYGLDVQSSNMASSDSMRADLAAGKIDIAESGLDNAVAMVVLAGADVIIVTGSSMSDQELIAQPDIKSARDFRGKTVVVDAPNTQNALMLKKILLLSGLKAGVDYQLKSVPPGGQRFVEMTEHKDYAGAMMAGTTAIMAKRQGFVSVGTSASAIGPLMYGGAFVRRQWASEHADLLARYIAANIEAQRWILAPANKDKVIELLRGTGESKQPVDVAAEAYETLIKGPGNLTKDLEFDVPAFKNMLKLRAEVEGSWGGKPPAPEMFYDLSYRKKALSMVSH
jgi:ABC-type nitrate/sulfonate/bicarbonate transport system substrate-binding protein